MQNKRFYAVLVLAVGIVLAALHVADLLQWMDASTGFALQASVWARYLPWLAALALPYLPARRVAAQPTELTDTNLPLGCCMLMTGALLLGSGLLSVSSAQTISAYPELYATTPAWTAWADVITPVLAGPWLSPKMVIETAVPKVFFIVTPRCPAGQAVRSWAACQPASSPGPGT